MVYQHPLAYLLGVEGTALLRSRTGEHDEAFVRERLAEVRRLLDTPALADHPGVHVRRGELATAYRGWAATYDEPNSLFELDEAIAHGILAGVDTGTALDAAGGTGRYAAHLAAHGHRVLGVDADEHMLARARHLEPGGWTDWPWTLLDLVPTATRAAWSPAVIGWHFRSPSRRR